MITVTVSATFTGTNTQSSIGESPHLANIKCPKIIVAKVKDILFLGELAECS